LDGKTFFFNFHFPGVSRTSMWHARV